MTLDEARNKEPPTTLLMLRVEDYSVLWCDSFWDGPVSGMLSYQGRECWFEMIQENENSEQGLWHRRYAIIALSPDQLARQQLVHEDFRRYVGYRCDGLQPKEQWHLFYDKHLEYVRSRKFEKCEVIAWFER